MKKLTGFLALMLSLALVACGGGGDEREEITTTTPTIPVAAIADVTFTQMSTEVVVTPGESFRPTIVKVTCLTVDATPYCKKQTAMGDIGFMIDLDLQDVKLFHDGQLMNGYVNREGSLYRFVPLTYESVWQQGTIEVVATLSPSAPTGRTTSVTVHATDASFDKTLEVLSGSAKIEVLSIPSSAPAEVTTVFEGYVVGNYSFKEQSTFHYTCKDTVIMGCRLVSFSADLSGAVPGSEIRIHVGDSWRYQAYVSQNGYASLPVQIEEWVPPGGSVKIRLETAMTENGSVWFSDFASHSGAKRIAPLLPSACTAVSPMNCKG